MSKNKVENLLSKIEEQTEGGNGSNEDFDKLFNYRCNKLINLMRAEHGLEEKDIGAPPDVPPKVREQVDEMIKIIN